MQTGSVYIIAEAGVNHNGDLSLARQLVDVAAEAGADAVKFQTFNAEQLADPGAEKAKYQQQTTGTEENQLEMLRKLELSKEDHLALLDHCKRREIQFLSTAFDLDSVDFLAGLDLPYWKIPSGEITHVPYLERIAATGKPVFISTGMAYLGEIEFALDQFLRNGYSREFITILHCTTDYPARFSDLNLNAIRSLQAAFGTGVGYSDHSSGLEASVAAVALGATVIEKHFTVDRTLPGPDHRASLEPDELAGLVRAIRNVSAALGDGLKGPTEPELANRPIVRKGIYASRSIQAGDLLGPENLVCKRPVGRLPAELWSRVVGKKASRDFAMGESLEL